MRSNGITIEGEMGVEEGNIFGDIYCLSIFHNQDSNFDELGDKGILVKFECDVY